MVDREEVPTASGPAVPLLDLAAHLAPLAADIHAAIDEVMATQRFIMGPQVEGFERALAEYCRAPFAYGVSSGTDALLAALMALEVKPGDEIITSPYTFFATAGAIARLESHARLRRHRPRHLQPRRRALWTAPSRPGPGGSSRCISSGRWPTWTRCFARPKERGLWVVEDAAQAIGAEHGRPPGRFAGATSVASASFPRRTSAASATAARSPPRTRTLPRKLDILRNHGARPKYHHSIIGANFRLDAIQAAVLRVELPHLDSWTSQAVERRSLSPAVHRSRVAASADAGGVAASRGGGGVAALDAAPVVSAPRAARSPSHLQSVRAAGA